MADVDTLSVRVGQRVRALRQNLGWRQIDLARKAVWSRASVANLEAGRQNIGLDQLEVLAHHLGVTPTELISDNGGPASLVDHREILIAALQRAEVAAVAGIKRSIAMQINGIRDAVDAGRLPETGGGHGA